MGCSFCSPQSQRYEPDLIQTFTRNSCYYSDDSQKSVEVEESSSESSYSSIDLKNCLSNSIHFDTDEKYETNEIPELLYENTRWQKLPRRINQHFITSYKNNLKFETVLPIWISKHVKSNSLLKAQNANYTFVKKTTPRRLLLGRRLKPLGRRLKCGGWDRWKLKRSS